MSGIASIVADDLVKAFMPVAEIMAREGRTQAEIDRAFRNHIGLKARKTFKPPAMKTVGSVLSESKILDMIASNKASADSSTERIMYDELKAAGVRFEFQRPIGPYTADFVIGSLVVEVDGPCHSEGKTHDRKRDAYLEARGYIIMRFPAALVAATPRAVVQAIQEEMHTY